MSEYRRSFKKSIIFHSRKIRAVFERFHSFIRIGCAQAISKISRTFKNSHIKTLTLLRQRQNGFIRARLIVMAVCFFALMLALSLFPWQKETQSEPALIQSNSDLILVQLPEKKEDFASFDNRQSNTSVVISETNEREETASPYRFDILDNQIDVEAVLVPREVAIISSSRDGKIISVPFHSGDKFQKGDVLIEYDCRELEAEAEIAETEKSLTQDKLRNSYKLFKLELLSVVDQKTFEVEDQKATARQRLFQARMDDCYIRADFDGRVTNRLANAGEYTRTDRVLMEVASTESLKADFLIPSKWLRWVNVGAPIQISIQETDKSYQAEITRIHGEVDPISQSIQMTAQIAPYEDRLLPGMSGQATIDVERIRAAGVKGYLEEAL
jgi:RND family efflux transporter MFP subunit